MTKNRKLGQDRKCGRKLEHDRKISQENSQKSNIWSKMKDLVKNLAKNLKFGQKSKICLKIENVSEKFGHKSQTWLALKT